MITSKLTTEARTAIPQRLRTALRLEEGDEIVYAITADGVVIDKAGPNLAEAPFTTFVEWSGDADGRVYAGL